MTTPIRPSQVERIVSEKFPGSTARYGDDGAIEVDVGLPEICAGALEDWRVTFDVNETLEAVEREVEKMEDFVMDVCA